MQIHFKAKDASSNIIRRFAWTYTPDDQAFSNLKSYLAQLFSIDHPFTIAYKDQAGDVITFSSKPELEELANEVERCNMPFVNLVINPEKQSPQEPSASQPEPMHEETPRQSPPQQEQEQDQSSLPNPEQFFSDIGNLFGSFASVACGPNGFRASTGPRFGPGHHRRGPRSHHHHWNRHRGWNRSQPTMNWNRFMDDMFSNSPFGTTRGPCRGNTSSFPNMENISTQVRQAVEELARYARTSAAGVNYMALLPTVPEIISLVRDFVQGTGNPAGPSSEARDTDVNARTDTLVQSIEGLVRPIIGDELMQRVTTVIRAGVNDENVMNYLRNLPNDMGPFGAFMPQMDIHMTASEDRGRETTGEHDGDGRPSFDIHRGIECDACGCSPIVGVRYTATNRNDYDICSNCYQSDDVSKDGIQFRECKYVWEASQPDATVPPSPLRLGSRGPTVLFLHKILRDLGYGDNIRLTGENADMYTNRTVEAMRQFQRDFHLTGVTQVGRYDEVTQASLMSILEAQVPPATATGGTAHMSTETEDTPMAENVATQPETQG